MKKQILGVTTCIISIFATAGLANACSKVEWNASSDSARDMVRAINADFEANPATETWNLYVTAFNRRVRGIGADLAPSCKILLTGIQGHVAASLQEMPATERWQDAGILFESYIATVDQVYDNLSQ